METPHVPTAREIMTSRLVTLSPEATIYDAASFLLKHGISGAPVVDPEGRLLGLLSEYDCLQAVAASDYEMDAHDTIESVESLMSRDLHTVSPEVGLFDLAHEFVKLRVRRLPVVEDGRLLGQVSRRDALAAAVKLHKEMGKAGHRYPDYPAGRAPIRDYP